MHATASPATVGSGAKRPRLLLIDANPAALKPVSGLLGERFALSFATDGLSGIYRAQSLRPDLILMDTCLPELGGLAACRLLKADASTAAIPIILVSARSEPQQRVSGLLAGAVDYVCKPLWPDEVLARVQVHVRPTTAHTHTPASPRHAAADPDRAYVEAACRLIDEHLSGLPSVGELAHAVGQDERHLTQLFRQHLGKTVSGYISERRMRAAGRLLIDTDMSVHAVATEVGFATAGNFSTAFRHHSGVSPLAWRRRHRQARRA